MIFFLCYLSKVWFFSLSDGKLVVVVYALSYGILELKEWVFNWSVICKIGIFVPNNDFPR